MRKLKTTCLIAGSLVGAQMLIAINVSAQDGYAKATGKAYKNSINPQAISGTGGDTNDKQTLITVLKELNRQKGVYFLFSEESLGSKIVNPVKDPQVAIEKILDAVLENTGLKYKKVSDNTFVILNAKDKFRKNENYNAAQFEQLTSKNNTTAIFDNISGKITGNDGTPLAGVSISVKGTNKGTTTNSRGEFTIDASKGDVLVISYVGYDIKEVQVGDDRTIGISLALTNQQLSEVVVTALGIRKDRKSLGYSVTEVKGNELTQAREINVANSLEGRVAGVNVSGVSGGPGSSTSVIIRGVSSLSGNNQPLYVINGVPMTNELATGNNLDNAKGQYFNSPDYGDGIQNINPDDIETISVLKGAAASALYGSRAKAGVILITTKNGSGKGTLEYNSNFVLDQVIDPTDWQYVYGNGANGLKPANAAAAYDAGNSSWGALLDGSSVVQFDGVSRPYTAQKDNIEKFYRTGSTFTNTLSFGKGFDGGSVRFSVTNLSNKSVLPNSGLDRNNFNFSANFTAVKRLTIEAKANYVSDKAKNRPILADGAGNANFQTMFLPSSLDINTLRPGTKPNGDELLFANNTYATNPWFATSKFINNTLRNRLIGSVSTRYTLDNGFFVQARIGRDFYYDRYTGVVPNGTGYYAQAFRNITEQYNRVSELNTDVLLGKTFKVNSDFSITANAGANLMKARAEGTVEGGTDFAVPYVYTILNAKNKTIDYTDFRQEVQSVYATVDMNYKGFLFLNASGRNDWFSTLAPSDDLDVFYPSVNTSFVFTEFYHPSWLNFGKLRVGWANVGGATRPYQTLLNYGLFPVQLNGLPLGNITNSSIPNSKLKPSSASEIEIGTELRLFDNRVGVDIAWYTKKSKNEIFESPASNTSGYTGVVLNIGELENKGIEFLVTGKPLSKGSAITWNTSVNGSVNSNKVISLTEGQAELAVGTSRTGFGFTRHIVGMAANQVMAFDYKYDAAGKIVLAANGVPERGDLKPWGSAYQKYTLGWNNEFTWKNFSAAFLIDGKFGGKVFSASDYYGYFFGLHKNTLVDRDKNFNPDPTGTPTTSQAYYTQLAGNVSRLFVYDASFIKFRQLTLGYNLPSKLFNNVIKGATISLVGRNLFIIMKKTDNIDPEASYSGYTQGLELGGVPPTRSYGLNLNVKF
jgi:TonB-linked SusC/RagA family outer membrane protein